VRQVAVATKRASGWAQKASKLSGAYRDKLPDAPFAPQLATLHDRPPKGDDWLHEIKWDGYRLTATVVGGRVRIWSRNAIEWTQKVPKLAAAIDVLGFQNAALDGELIAGKGTQADFNVLKTKLSTTAKQGLALVLFDIVHADGWHLDRVPLIERKELLQQVLAKPPTGLAYSAHIPSDGAAAFALAAEQKFEGIISKLADSTYHQGRRTDDWWKIKALGSDEFAVVGFTPSKNLRAGFGSLLLASPDPSTKSGWRYAGKVGTGFSGTQLRELRAFMGDVGSPTPTVEISDEKRKDLAHATWFLPLFVVEVFTRGRSTSGVLRQPSFKAVRTDKDVEDLREPHENQ
jgi:bifunctional non-homologous end joining protein LigD